MSLSVSHLAVVYQVLVFDVIATSNDEDDCLTGERREEGKRTKEKWQRLVFVQRVERESEKMQAAKEGNR